MSASRRSGFTLIEMSVVLVIIGFIAGGIMIGGDMIRQSRLRAVVSELDRYLKAIQTFQDKYYALPGDMSNAETYWGTDTTCPNNTSGLTTKRTVTCNGNANGKIGDSTTAGVLSSQTEWFRAWQQLANAQLIDGSYTGVRGADSGDGSTNQHAVVGQNVPASALEGAGWTLLYHLVSADTAEYWAASYQHAFHFGAPYSAGGVTQHTMGGIMTGVEAFGIDTKIDDGKPNTGKVMARHYNSTVNAGCTNSSSLYVTTTSTRSCGLIFITGF